MNLLCNIKKLQWHKPKYVEGLLYASTVDRKYYIDMQSNECYFVVGNHKVVIYKGCKNFEVGKEICQEDFENYVKDNFINVVDVKIKEVKMNWGSSE